jgi:hypothetical protein
LSGDEAKNASIKEKELQENKEAAIERLKKRIEHRLRKISNGQSNN